MPGINVAGLAAAGAWFPVMADENYVCLNHASLPALLDWGQAMVAVDLEKLNRIFADDWTSIGASGAVVTKEKMLRDFKSGDDRPLLP